MCKIAAPAVPEKPVRISRDLLSCLNALIASGDLPDKDPTAFIERMINEKWNGPQVVGPTITAGYVSCEFKSGFPLSAADFQNIVSLFEAIHHTCRALREVPGHDSAFLPPRKDWGSHTNPAWLWFENFLYRGKEYCQALATPDGIAALMKEGKAC